MREFAIFIICVSAFVPLAIALGEVYGISARLKGMQKQINEISEKLDALARRLGK